MDLVVGARYVWSDVVERLLVQEILRCYGKQRSSSAGFYVAGTGDFVAGTESGGTSTAVGYERAVGDCVRTFRLRDAAAVMRNARCKHVPAGQMNVGELDTRPVPEAKPARLLRALLSWGIAD